jgi:hypothetical protein
MLDLSQLKGIDALLRHNDYDDEVFTKILPYVASYFEAASALRALPLTEVKGATVMLAGGKR